MIESVAGVLLSAEGVLLILRRDVPIWVLPGGGVEPDENPEHAIIREILEETGFHVKVKRIIGTYTPVNRLAKKTVLYECEILSGAPTPSSETKAVRFFNLQNLPPMPPPYPEWIQDALQPHTVTRALTSVNYKTFFLLLLKHPLLVARFLLSRMGLQVNT